jgi:hypothetical protein
LLGGKLFSWFGDDYSAVGSSFAMVFAVGILVAFWSPSSQSASAATTATAAA